jgi:hypothetical protein
MTDQPKVGLHIGLPKTGTTTLQELVFARHPDLRYFGQTNIWTDAEAKRVLHALLVAESPSATEAPELIQWTANRYRAVVISDEALSLGEFMLRATRWSLDSTPETMAARARAILGHAYVLIVLRNQADWLVSFHRQGLKTGKYCEADLGRWLERELGPGRRARLFELLRYDRLIRAYEDAFGQEHVTVHLYERVKTDLGHVATPFLNKLNVDASGVPSLLANNALNVTEGRFNGLPPWLQKTVRTTWGRNLLSTLPSSTRRYLRNVVARDRAYQDPDPALLSELAAEFRESNHAVLDNLGLSQFPDSDGCDLFRP